MNHAKRWIAAAVLTCGAPAAIAAPTAEAMCGSLDNHYGPYDYRTELNGKLRVLNRFHFTPKVEALIAGESTAYIGDDLSYVLRTSPNHLRALIALVKLGERSRSPQPAHMEFSIDCYFERAHRFAPDDTVVRILHAQYLGKTGRTSEAVRQLEFASEQAKDNPVSQYNIGLVYFELKDYAHALAQAHKAAAMGYTRSELPDQLKGSGHWQDPAAAAASAPEAQRL